MQTAALFTLPEPRNMAVRPVDCMADMILEGGSVPVVVTILDVSENDVSRMPGSCSRTLEMSLTQPSQVIGTENEAS